MFDRLINLAVGSVELIQAESRLLIHRAQRLCLHACLLLLAAAFVLLGAIGLAVVAGMLLAQWLGVIAALAIMTGLLIAAGLAVGLVTRRLMRQATRPQQIPMEIRQRIHQSKGKIFSQQRAVSGPDSGDPSLKQKALAFMVHHPGVTAGAALTALGLLGPLRTARFLGRAVMAVGIASGVSEQVRSDHDREAEQADPDRKPSPVKSHKALPLREQNDESGRRRANNDAQSHDAPIASG